MFPDDQVGYVIIPALVLIAAAAVLIFVRARRFPRSPLLAATTGLQISAITMGIALMVAWFLLPSTPVLRTFGYPNSVDDIQSTKQLLHYLQSYDKSLVRTTEVVYWLLFLFVFQFLSAVFSFSIAFGRFLRSQPQQSLTSGSSGP